MAVRHFITYMPGWMPCKTRQEILKDKYFAFCYDSFGALMMGTDLDLMDKDEIDLAKFMLAYARDGGKHAFLYSDKEWQEACAKYMLNQMMEKLSRRYAGSFADSFSLSWELIGMVRKSGTLRFNWMQISGTVDELKLVQYMSNGSSAHNFYQRRWADKRYGFATPRSCPYPGCLSVLQRTNDMGLGVALDYLIQGAISRQSFGWMRNTNMSDLIHRRHDKDDPRPERFMFSVSIIAAIKGYIPDLRTKLNDCKMKFIAGVKDAGLHTRQDIFANNHVPATVIAEIDSLIEPWIEKCDTTYETVRDVLQRLQSEQMKLAWDDLEENGFLNAFLKTPTVVTIAGPPVIVTSSGTVSPMGP